jgi:hypothetical protein
VVATRNASRKFNRLTNGFPTPTSVTNTTSTVTTHSRERATAAVAAAWTTSSRRCSEVVVAVVSKDLLVPRRESQCSTH